MLTSYTLYNAVRSDEFDELNYPTCLDYGFVLIKQELIPYLFGAYQSISKFMSKEEFSKKMHEALTNKTLNELVEEETKKIPPDFRNHWYNFKSNGGLIKPFYIN
jgi:hypothetical protein